MPSKTTVSPLKPGAVTPLAIELVPLADLRPHPDNARNGDTDAIIESIRVNGVYRPLVVARDGTILAGNHSYASLLELGQSKANVVRLDIDPDSAAAKRIMLADNRTADLGRYDDAALLTMLQGLNDSDSLLGTGYEVADMEVLAHLWDDPLDLDELADQVGDVTDADRMVRLVLTVEPSTAKAWRERVRDHTDDSLLTSLLLS